MATAWAEAAARLERRFALVEQFQDLAFEARKNLRAATNGHRQPTQGNGSGQTN